MQNINAAEATMATYVYFNITGSGKLIKITFVYKSYDIQHVLTHPYSLICSTLCMLSNHLSFILLPNVS